MSGTSRRPTRAQAASTTMLRASLRLEAWMAFTESAGRHQFSSQGWRLPSSFTPLASPACRANSFRVTGRRAMLLFSLAESGRTSS